MAKNRGRNRAEPAPQPEKAAEGPAEPATVGDKQPGPAKDMAPENPDTNTLNASRKCPPGMTRVRAITTLLHGGMSYEPGRVLFVSSETVPRRERLGQIEILEEV